jgi:hypothetical protein
MYLFLFFLSLMVRTNHLILTTCVICSFKPPHTPRPHTPHQSPLQKGGVGIVRLRGCHTHSHTPRTNPPYKRGALELRARGVVTPTLTLSAPIPLTKGGRWNCAAAGLSHPLPAPTLIPRPHLNLFFKLLDIKSNDHQYFIHLPFYIQVVKPEYIQS